MGGTFFLSWPLWQQMTFFLGVAIGLVFAAGLLKLWWITRRTRKLILIDEEKRARLQEIRRTGLPAKTGMEIPFGVRAIQSGVEIEGIWISRPNTPVGTPVTPTFPGDQTASQVASSTTLTGDVGSSEQGGANGKGKGRENGGGGADMSYVSSSSSDGEREGNRTETYKPKGSQADYKTMGVNTYVPTSTHGGRPTRSTSPTEQSSQPVPLRPLTSSRNQSRNNSPTTGTFPPATPQDVSSGRRSPQHHLPSGRGSPQNQHSSGRRSPQYIPSSGRRSPPYQPSSGRCSPQHQHPSGRPSPPRDNTNPFATPSQTPVMGAMNMGNNASDLDLRQPARTFGPGDAHRNRYDSGNGHAGSRDQDYSHSGSSKLQKSAPRGYM